MAARVAPCLFWDVFVADLTVDNLPEFGGNATGREQMHALPMFICRQPGFLGMTQHLRGVGPPLGPAGGVASGQGGGRRSQQAAGAALSLQVPHTAGHT